MVSDWFWVWVRWVVYGIEDCIKSQRNRESNMDNLKQKQNFGGLAMFGFILSFFVSLSCGCCCCCYWRWKCIRAFPKLKKNNASKSITKWTENKKEETAELIKLKMKIKERWCKNKLINKIGVVCYCGCTKCISNWLICERTKWRKRERGERIRLANENSVYQ